MGVDHAFTRNTAPLNNFFLTSQCKRDYFPYRYNVS
jgi:hypothetical protein